MKRLLIASAATAGLLGLAACGGNDNPTGAETAMDAGADASAVGATGQMEQGAAASADGTGATGYGGGASSGSATGPGTSGSGTSGQAGATTGADADPSGTAATPNNLDGTINTTPSHRGTDPTP